MSQKNHVLWNTHDQLGFFVETWFLKRKEQRFGMSASYPLVVRYLHRLIFELAVFRRCHFRWCWYGTSVVVYFALPILSAQFTAQLLFQHHVVYLANSDRTSWWNSTNFSSLSGSNGWGFARFVFYNFQHFSNLVNRFLCAKLDRFNIEMQWMRRLELSWTRPDGRNLYESNDQVTASRALK